MNIQRNSLSAIACPLGLAVSAILMALLSWRKWPDILVDFGRELYIPWQISSGKTLYKDLAHLFGPLSQYFHSVLFRLFGVSYTTIIVSNLVILLIFLCALYLLLVRITSRAAAVTSCGVVIFVFAFSQYTVIGNYNFVSPYSHEATHGLVLSLLMICQMYLFRVRQKRLLLFTAGLTLGLVSLTKMEVFLSAAITAGFFFLLLAITERKLGFLLSSASLFLIGFLLPPSTFFTYFCVSMPAKDSLQAVFAASGVFLKGGIVDNPFYIRGMGFDNVPANLSRMLVHTLVFLAVLSLVYLLDRYHAKPNNRRMARCLVAVGLMAVTGAAYFVSPYHIGASLPVLDLISFTLILAYSNFSLKRNRQEWDKLIPLLLWALFSILLLAKIVLNARLFHYGFYLALPSVVLLVIMTVWFLPMVMERHQQGGILFRNTMIAVFVVITVHFLSVSASIYAKKVFPVGIGPDRIVTSGTEIDDRGFFTAQAVEWITSHAAPNESVLVLPEGVMLNYLTRRINPTKFTNMMVPELIAYGETVILAEITAHCPDYIVLVHKDTSEYGVGYFGTDPRNGMRIMAWVNNHYSMVSLLGSEPFRGERFGIKIMKRKY
jgi:hypothetical protein